ncbi:hypothetical protein [Luteimonas mephitis]|uniref:hypothetical protein n=1 Tax=Luteimonas mephitis TaxID=83615 RepID=UPI003A95DD94
MDLMTIDCAAFRMRAPAVPLCCAAGVVDRNRRRCVGHRRVRTDLLDHPARALRRSLVFVPECGAMTGVNTKLTLPMAA